MSKLDSTNRGISERFGKTGQLISLQAKITLGTAGRYVYRSKTAKLDPALTPAKARAAAKKQLETWMDAERKRYDEYAALCASGELSEAECADYTLYLKNLDEARQSAALVARSYPGWYALTQHCSKQRVPRSAVNPVLWRNEVREHHNRDR